MIQLLLKICFSMRESATIAVMRQIDEFVDERNKTWCIHCGISIYELKVSRDHVPSKVFLSIPYSSNLPVVPICKQCNESFALDEEYVAVFLSCVVSGTTEPDGQKNIKYGKALTKHPKLRIRIQKSRKKRRDAELIQWEPEIERVERVVIKNARGHAFYECGEPVLAKPTRVEISPLEIMNKSHRNSFEIIDLGGLLPEVGSRMMTRVLCGNDLRNGWVNVQEGIYRYCVAQQNGILVRSIIFDYLATEVFWAQ